MDDKIDDTSENNVMIKLCVNKYKNIFNNKGANKRNNI